jgi:hypothetical protein
MEKFFAIEILKTLIYESAKQSKQGTLQTLSPSEIEI